MNEKERERVIELHELGIERETETKLGREREREREMKNRESYKSVSERQIR